ncbi:High-affinity nitrate transporter [Parasponia andersonii]|uniref:High-affinity nitrate transporter n=1 Tax=Parasponia andersonii TaxID=3476 RepID=A0A2P5DGD5_PARAD|nr:High-affinity nitrate transporter [Parasponia andersonii]
MAGHGLLLASLLILSCFAETSFGTVYFSSLQRTLIVTASPKQGQVLKAGEDKITVNWALNTTFPAGTDSAYKTIKVKLCYAPASQVERGWRKTVDDLSKDKTCQFNIVARPYSASNKSFEWTVERDLPLGTYFVRAYAYNSEDAAVAFGQTTDPHKTTNLFNIEAISGRHLSLDVTSICFSAFSVLSLFGFFWYEKREAKSSQQK